MYSKELKTSIQTKTCTWVSTAALFIIAKRWEKLKCHWWTMDEQMHLSPSQIIPLPIKQWQPKKHLMDENQTHVDNLTNYCRKEWARLCICTTRYGIYLFGFIAPSYHWKLLLLYHNSYRVECGGVSGHSESFPKSLLRGVLQIILFLKVGATFTTFTICSSTNK